MSKFHPFLDVIVAVLLAKNDKSKIDPHLGLTCDFSQNLSEGALTSLVRNLASRQTVLCGIYFSTPRGPELLLVFVALEGARNGDEQEGKAVLSIRSF